MRNHLLLSFFLLAIFVGSSFATWYAPNYNYRFPANCSNMQYSQSFLVNRTAGFTLNGSRQLVWSVCAPELYVYYNDSTHYIIANNTTQFPQEVEFGTGANYTASSVWTGENATAIIHFGASNTTLTDSLGKNNLTRGGTNPTNCFTEYNGTSFIGYYGYLAVGNPSCAWRNVAPIGMSPVANASTDLLLFKRVGTDLGGAYYVGGESGARNSRGIRPYVAAGSAIGTMIYGIDPNTNLSGLVRGPVMLAFQYTASATSGYVWQNLNKSSAFSIGAALNIGTAEFMIGGYGNGSETTGGYIDEFRSYNDTKSDAYIASFYLNTNGSTSSDGLKGYGDLGASENVPPQNATVNIAFISQSPSVITSSNLDSSNLNISYNITNITSGTPLLAFKSNTTTNDIDRFINGSAVTGWQYKTGTNVSSAYNFSLDDHEVYPFTANLNMSDFEATAHTSFPLSANTNFLSTELLNVSNSSQFSFLMLMANGSTASPLRYYYCNSTYDFTSSVLASPNCFLFGSIPANTPPNVSHGNTSYIIVPMPINATAGTIQGSTVKITKTSYIMIRGVTVGTAQAWYIPKTSRTSATKSSTNSGASWTNQTFTADLHLHQFDGTELFRYQVFANVSGALNNSSIVSQTMQPQPQPPTAPIVLTPTSGNKYGMISISWTQALNLTPATLYYNVSLLDTNLSFVKTIIDNTSNLSYVWNSAGTTQGAYIIRVMAIQNDSFNSSDISDQFNVATFNATLITPNNAVLFAGSIISFTYSTNPAIAPASCDIRVDAATLNTQTGLAGTYNATLNLSTGSHSWVVNCSDTEGAGFSYQTASRTFDINFSSFNLALNLTATQENVLASPQALFYDVNGNLNVLYFTDEIVGNMLRIKTISNNTVIATYNTSLVATSPFIIAMREQNKTVLLMLNATDTTKGYLVNLTSTITVDSVIFPNASVQPNTLYDPYTYANSKQYASLGLNGSSYYLFTVPLPSGSITMRRNVSGTSFLQIGATFPNGVAAQWQILANNSNLSAWYYLKPTDLGGGLSKITLKYYDGAVNSTIADIDVHGYNASQLNSSYGIFERYNASTYVMTSNLPNTTIYRVEDGLQVNISDQIVAPSHFFFVDKDTFIFFSKVGSITTAYSCYFGVVPANCKPFSSTAYGLVVPYERGTMTTAKRDSSNYDTVVRGVISSADVVSLAYNLNTYDIKYLCYDEMAESRDQFTVQIQTDTSSTILQNASWGYVIPSAQLGSGLKKSFFICTSGVQRLFLSGLTGSYIINAYSLVNTSGAYYTFTIQDGYGQPLQGVKLTAYRFSNLFQSYVVIEQGITDFTGSSTFFLQPYALYKMTVEQGGYLTLNFDFNPTSITSITLKMANSGTGLQIPTFSYIWDDVAYSQSPGNAFSTNATNATFQISSNSSTLEYFGMQVIETFPNGTRSVVYTNNVSSQPSGGTLTYPITATGSYQIQTFFKAQNHTTFTPFAQIFTYSNGSSSFIQARNQYIATQPITGWTMYMFAVIIALLAAGWMASNVPGIGEDGSAIAALVVLWGFTIFMTPMPGSGVPDIILVCMIQVGATCSAAITPLVATSFTTLAVLSAIVARHYI